MSHMALIGSGAVLLGFGALTYLAARKGVDSRVNPFVKWVTVGYILLEMGVSVPGVVNGIEAMIGAF